MNFKPSRQKNKVLKWLQHSSADMYSVTKFNQTGVKLPLKHTAVNYVRGFSDLRRQCPVSSSSAARTTNMQSIWQPPITSGCWMWKRGWTAGYRMSQPHMNV